MPIRTLALVAVMGVACTAPASPTPSPAPTVTAAPTAAPTPVPTVAPTVAPTAAPTTPATSDLEGTWETAATTCEQQNAALTRAGFTAEQLDMADWDPANCSAMMHGRVFTIRFAGNRLVAFQDGAQGWTGTFQQVDDWTIEAGDSGDLYITYTFTIDGDQLTMDMVRDDYPTTSEAELAGEQLAQTVIYESAPFTRQP